MMVEAGAGKQFEIRSFSLPLPVVMRKFPQAFHSVIEAV
jgi:hypothetical protein